MIKQKVPVEVEVVLKNLNIDILEGLANIAHDQKMLATLRFLLTLLKQLDESKIIRSAGGITSMDKMIDASINQSFYRGRISLAVLINALLVNTPPHLDKATEKKEKSK